MLDKMVLDTYLEKKCPCSNGHVPVLTQNTQNTGTHTHARTHTRTHARTHEQDRFPELDASHIYQYQTYWGQKHVSQVCAWRKALIWETQICNLFSADCEMKSGQILSV